MKQTKARTLSGTEKKKKKENRYKQAYMHTKTHTRNAEITVEVSEFKGC